MKETGFRLVSIPLYDLIAPSATAATVGVNFISILQAAFACANPESAKRQSGQAAFCSFEICVHKAAPRKHVDEIDPSCQTSLSLFFLSPECASNWSSNNYLHYFYLLKRFLV